MSRTTFIILFVGALAYTIYATFAFSFVDSPQMAFWVFAVHFSLSYAISQCLTALFRGFDL